jgi:methylenetetrahydrofolate--tRNA-(uracil-5-)-methyltransferase
LSRESNITIIGAGLAGCELALQLAERSFPVTLIEQKPVQRTQAQNSDNFCELVCSNSFRGAARSNAVGLLKEEMRLLGSFVMRAADATRVPAGGALAVDRSAFGQMMTEWVKNHKNIKLVSRCEKALPDVRPLVVATGPLTAESLAADLGQRFGNASIAYYDAISPIISADSINWSRVFVASRWDKGESDEDRRAYVNCPLERDEYFQLVSEIRSAEKVPARDFEDPRYFEGCLPIEVMAERGDRTLAFGPLKPVGLIDPRTSRRPYAVVQLRAENLAATDYNIVGFQTRMVQKDQLRIIRSIPGLEQAKFERFGSVHRNTFINSPILLDGNLRCKADSNLWFAGQITGVEGYVESAASGLVAALLMDDVYNHRPPSTLPDTTAIGSLIRYLCTEHKCFQPTNVTHALFPPLEITKRKRSRAERGEAIAERALDSLQSWWSHRNSGLDAVAPFSHTAPGSAETEFK